MSKEPLAEWEYELLFADKAQDISNYERYLLEHQFTVENLSSVEKDLERDLEATVNAYEHRVEKMHDTISALKRLVKAQSEYIERSL
jgi:predicted ribosome quality control (RQC) complex YloA/Tae2 family protein